MIDEHDREIGGLLDRFRELVEAGGNLAAFLSAQEERIKTENGGAALSTERTFLAQMFRNELKGAKVGEFGRRHAEREISRHLA